MGGTGGRGAAAALLLAAAVAAAGCCGPRGRGTGRDLNRDTPANAFAFFREAFEAEQPGDQYDCFHPDFEEQQGLTRVKYTLARSLAPGLFRKARDLLGKATLDGDPEHLRITTGKGPRDGVRLHLATPEGRGTFLLVDSPTWEIRTDDASLPDLSGPVQDLAGDVRIVEGRLVVHFETPLDFPPEDGAKVLRATLHHDWLLWRIESLEGFEEFLGQVKETADRANKEEAPR